MRLIAIALGFAAILICPIQMSAAPAQNKISVLIVDGMNNHDWPRGTKLLKASLDDSGMFTVDVSTSPTNKNASPEEWAQWRPDFAKYLVVVNNFNGGFKTND